MKSRVQGTAYGVQDLWLKDLASKLRTILYLCTLIAVPCSLLLSCAAPVETLVPVATPCPQPPELIRPHLALQDLQPVAAPSEVLRAYVITVQQLQGYACELETIINGYRQHK